VPVEAKSASLNVLETTNFTSLAVCCHFVSLLDRRGRRLLVAQLAELSLLLAALAPVSGGQQQAAIPKFVALLATKNSGSIDSEAARSLTESEFRAAAQSSAGKLTGPSRARLAAAFDHRSEHRTRASSAHIAAHTTSAERACAQKDHDHAPLCASNDRLAGRPQLAV
jgi:hypothetical protein